MEKTERVIAIFRLISLVLTAILLCGTSVAHAETAVGGAIVANTTWSAAQGPYLVTADVSVESGAVLSVEAGVTVRFQTGRRLIIHNGALRIAGTAATPVTLTSALNIPTGTPAAGDWGGVQFLDGTVDAATLVEHLTISYGSTTAIFGASPTFNNCRFEHNSGYAISIDLASFPHGSGNSAIGNGVNAIQVPAGEMTTSGIWDFTAIPYFLDGIVSVGAAPTLSGVTPSSIEQSSVIDATILGTRLNGATRVLFGDPTVTAAIQAGGTPLSLPVKITASAMSVLGLTGITVSTPAGDVSLPSALTVTPPLPAITAVTPDTLFVSRPTTTITIAGSNFSTDSVVYLAGSALTTTFVSSTRLEASVPPQTIAEIKQVQVKNPDPRNPAGLLVSNSAPFTVVVPQFTLAPSTLTVRQGSSDTLTLSIPFAAPVGGITANLVSTNVLAATVPATITIPQGATSVALSVSAPATANSHDVILEVHANQNNWTGTKSTITVRPEPTVNLSPVTLLSGQGFSFFLTVTLTDPAPAGGLTVNLTADTANVISFPASVVVAAGATQAQVTVLNSGTGNTIISATPAIGSGFSSGDKCAVTVRPVQTFAINPVISQVIGVQVGTPSAPTTPPTPITALMSRPVGVVSGSVITGMTPDHAPFGTQNLLVRINGSGFAADSSIFISPILGPPTPLYDVTVGPEALVIAADGSYIEFRLNIAEGAQISDRVIVVTSGGKNVPPATAEANRFKVTRLEPQLLSLIPNSGVIGTSFTLQVNGRNLFNISAVSFEPPEGISVSNSISVSADGTLVSVPIVIDAAAASGSRVVRITTSAGTTTAVMNVGNSFTVWNTAGTTYSEVASNQVGVMVTQSTTVTPAGVNFAPVTTQPIGVSVGSVITGITPSSGAKNSTNMTVRLSGYNLTDVNSIEFYPLTDTGLTVAPGSLTVATDGSYVEALISITDTPSLTPRTVVLKTPTQTVPPAFPGANVFRVTLQQPQLLGLMPTQREVASSFTLSLSGKTLTGATVVAFDPPDGITVVNPPAVSADGTIATVTVNIAANAPTTARNVTITTPGGTTNSTQTASNTFSVTALAGTPYNSVTSQSVGVRVQETGTVTPPTINFGPAVSPVVGVYVEPAAAGVPPNTNYGSFVSGPVGVIVGSAIYSMSPTNMQPDTTTTVTFTGIGLDQVTSLSIAPLAGMTIGTPVPSGDGTSMTVKVTAGSATREPRALIPWTSTAAISIPVPGINLLYVGAKPAISNVLPISQMVGNTVTLTIVGTNLGASTMVRFEPPDGILVGNPPIINAAGTQATVTISIEGTAPGGYRVIVIDGPYGPSSSIADATNTFFIDRPTVSAPQSVIVADNVSKTKNRDQVAVIVSGRPGSTVIALVNQTMFGISVWRTGISQPFSSQLPLGKVQSLLMAKGMPHFENCLPLQSAANMNRGYRGPPINSKA